MAIAFEIKITYTIVVMYSLYLFFLDGLSLRNASQALVIFRDEKRRGEYGIKTVNLAITLSIVVVIVVQPKRLWFY